MKLLGIAILGCSLLMSGAVFADYATPEGNGNVTYATYPAPEGNRNVTYASYASPEGNGYIDGA
jgi:hypothetical protein